MAMKAPTHTEKKTLQMRPYQLEAHKALDDFFSQEGQQRGIVNLPTGCGKTITGLDYGRKRNGRMLWIAHRDELITQPIQAMQAVWPEASTGIVKAELNEMDAQCVFASIQTLHRRLDQLPKFGPDDLVVVDECHHAAARTYMKTLEAVGAFREDGPPVVGLTATVERADKVGLDSAFQEIVYQYQMLQAIRDGYLVDLKVERVPLKLNLDEIHTVAGDFNQSELDEALLRANVSRAVAEAYIEHAKGKKAIVFTVSVDQAIRTAEALQAEGVAAEWISGALPTDERRAILKRLKTGETQVVVNCMVLTEGFDEPSVECVVVARPTKSRSLYIQMIGRGTRKAPGKDHCLILDVTGVSKRHKLVTAPTLFGLQEVPSGKSITEALDEMEERQSTEVDRLKSLLDTEKNELQEFKEMIKWLKVAPDIYALSAGDAGTVIIFPAEDGNGFHAKISKRYEPDEYLTQSPVWLELAQGIAEDYLRRSAELGLIKQNAFWRRHDVTPRQQQILRFLKPWLGEIPSYLNRGKASDLITIGFVRKEMNIKPWS